MERNIQYVPFPSEEIDPQKKGMDWHLQSLKAITFNAMHVGSYQQRKKHFAKLRSYGDGTQDVKQYYPRLGVTQEDIKNSTSWKNIDFTQLKILKKYINILVTKMRKYPNELKVLLSDAQSVDKSRQKQAHIKSYIATRDLQTELQAKAKVNTPNPIPPGVPEPETVDEVAITIDMYLPDPEAVEMRDKLGKTFDYNHKDDLEEQLSRDLATVGLAGTRTRMGGNRYYPKIEACVPEQMLLPKSRYNDYRDAPYMGELFSCTIADLRKLDHNNQITEKQYLELASSRRPNLYGGYTLDSAHYFFNNNNHYPYDDLRIDVVFAEWKSHDKSVFLARKNKKKNLSVRRKDHNWYDPEKGTDPAGNKVTDRKVYVDTIENIYQGFWIPGTEIVFGWGLQESMERNREDYSAPRFSIKAYKTGNSSFVEDTIALVNNIHVNWYQLQHHQNESKPDGFAYDEESIDMRGGEGDGEGGEGGMSWDENVRMHKQTGSILVTLRSNLDALSGSKPFPVQAMPGGMSAAAKDHWGFILSDMELIQNMTGLTAPVSASNIHPETGKAVTQIMAASGETSISYLIDAFANVKEQTAQRVVFLIAEAMRIARHYKKSYQDVMQTLADHEYEVQTVPGYTEYQRQILANQIETSLANQLLLPEHATIITLEENIERAKHLFVKFRREMEQKAAQRAENEIRMNSEQSQAAAKQAMEAKLAELEKDWQMKTAHEVALKKADLELEVAKMKHELEKMRMEHDYQDNQREKEHQDTMEELEYKGENELTKAGAR